MIEGIQNIILYNVYREFYEEEPNLSIDNKDKLNVKMQALILAAGMGKRLKDLTHNSYIFKSGFEMPCCPEIKTFSKYLFKSICGYNNLCKSFGAFDNKAI